MDIKLANEKIKYKECSPQALKDFPSLGEMYSIKTINELCDFLSWHDYDVEVDFAHKLNELQITLNGGYWWFIYSFKDDLILMDID